ncbi:Protein kinase domain-containing protein [Caenorhabditis elegans]|nr:Protein kinase domain-containing protein [Caenorhabditis elegans]CDK13621.1 Protein kinase domain-containing protein [Caenorhabditis elegans]|eukprot:NP_001293840.1 Uncharacterized protein CELE_Y73B6A.1 [Caenorhabditis elegans]
MKVLHVPGEISADTAKDEITVMKKVGSAVFRKKNPSFLEFLGAYLVEGHSKTDPKLQFKNKNGHPLPEKAQFVAIFMELVEGGRSIGDFPFKTDNERKSFVCQLVVGLMTAQKELGFSHGDLSVDNTIVTKTKLRTVAYILEGKAVKLKTSGVLLKIIDYGKSECSSDNKASTSFEDSDYTKLRNHAMDVFKVPGLKALADAVNNYDEEHASWYPNSELFNGLIE